MANAWQAVDIIAAEALSVLEDNLVIMGLCARDKSADFNTRPNGYAVGDSVRIKTNPAYEAQEFTSAITVQGIRSSTRTMTIEKHFDVSVSITAKEKALDLDNFVDQVVRPAAITIGEKCETYVAGKILSGHGLYVSDDLLGSAADIALARKAANYQQLSTMGRFVVVDDTLEAKLLGQTWFNQSQTRGLPGVSTLQTGTMGTVMGFDWYGSLYFPTPTAFTAGSMICTTNNTNGTKNLIGDTDLIVDNQTASQSIKVGDRLQIAGVRRPLVVKTAIPDTSATTTVALTDPITEIIPDDAAVTVIGSGEQYTSHGAIFDSGALAIAMPMLDPPSDKPSYVISNNGVSIRVVQGYDIASKTETMSFDVLIGAAAYDPRRITLLAELAAS